MLSTKLTVFTKLALLATLGLALGSAGMFYYQKNQVRRSIASLGPYQPRGLMIGKQAAAMTVEIVGPASYPDNNSEVVELVGYITQHLSADSSLTYTWHLPTDVELVRGPLNDTLANLRMGRPQPVSILVRGFSAENQKMIGLKTQVHTSGGPLAASAVIVSRPEDTKESRVMDWQAQAAAEAAEAAKDKETESENQ